MSTTVHHVALTVTPSFAFGNLTACAHSVAFAHKDAVYALGSSALDGRGAASLKRVALKDEGGASVTSCAWVQLSRSGRASLAVASRDAVTVFAPNGAYSSFAPHAHCALADVPALAGRPPGVHFLRGLAVLPEHGLLLVGTSWGDVVVLRVGGGGGGAGAPAALTQAAVLSGAHSAAISAIAADDRHVITADDAGVIAQWGVAVAEGGASVAPPRLIARHDKSEGGSPCTAVGLTACGGALVATFADGLLRVFRTGTGGGGGESAGGAAAAAAPGACFMEAEVVAHTRAASALAVHPSRAAFATAGMDGVVCSWSLPELPGATTPRVGRVQLDSAQRVPIPSTALTGLAFVTPAGASDANTALLAATAYDSHQLHVFF